MGEDVATGVANKLTPVTVSAAAAEQQRLAQALRTYQAPPIEFYFVPVIAAAGGWYLAVVVPPSPRAPHAVLGLRDDEKHPLRYPVRHDRGTIWLSEHEVAERYRRRLSAHEDQENRADRVAAAGREVLIRSSCDGVWLYVSVVPEFPAGDLRLDTAAVNRVDDWRRRFSQPSPLGRDLAAYGRALPAPGKVTFSDSRSSGADEEGTIRTSYLELHLDGSAFAAKAVNPFGDGDRQEVGDRTIADDLVVLVDVVLRWCADQSGSMGTATVIAGFVQPSGRGSHVDSLLTLVGEVGRVLGTRKTLNRLITTVVAVDLSAVETLQQRLAVVHLVHTGLLHFFGIAESRNFRHDGQIDPGAFDSRAQETDRWARDYGVPLWSDSFR